MQSTLRIIYLPGKRPPLWASKWSSSTSRDEQDECSEPCTVGNDQDQKNTPGHVLALVQGVVVEDKAILICSLLSGLLEYLHEVLRKPAARSPQSCQIHVTSSTFAPGIATVVVTGASFTGMSTARLQSAREFHAELPIPKKIHLLESTPLKNFRHLGFLFPVWKNVKCSKPPTRKCFVSFLEKW